MYIYIYINLSPISSEKIVLQYYEAHYYKPNGVQFSKVCWFPDGVGI